MDDTLDDIVVAETPGLSRYRPPEPMLPLGFDDDVPFDHDPLDPHPDIPTPLDLVVRLTRAERVSRVQRLVQMAWNSYDRALDSIRGKKVHGTCVLVSGGNDSYTVAHVFRSVTTHWVHANTGTGIEETRRHVRGTAAAWGVPLLEYRPRPGEGYFDLVRGLVMARSRETGQLVQAWPGGFPGHAAHAIMYQRLKERAFSLVPHEFRISGSQDDQVVFIAGRRRPESKMRTTVPHYERKGTIFWSSPLAIWHKADLRAYRLTHTDIPVNPVAVILGMSGECGCLSNAVADERDRWFTAYPNDPFVREIQATEAELRDRPDIPEHRKTWGWGSDPATQAAEKAYLEELRKAGKTVETVEFESDAVCSVHCGTDPLFDAMDPLFEQELPSMSPETALAIERRVQRRRNAAVDGQR